MAQVKILCVAFDKTLKERLCTLLTRVGYEIVGTTRTKHAMQVLTGNEFDLIILGHRFPKKERRELSALARHKYEIKVLLMCDGSSDDEVPADDVVYALHGTDALLNAVDGLLRKKALAAAQS